MISIRNNIESISLYALIILSVTPLFEAVDKILLSGLVLVVVFIYKGAKNPGLRNSVILVLMFGVTVLYGLILDLYVSSAEDVSLFGFFIVLNIFIGYFFATKYPRLVILGANSKLMVASSLVGIPIYVTSLYYPIYSFLPSYQYYNTIHSTAFFVNLLQVDGSLVARYASFASEPGLAQVLLNLAIAYRIEKVKNIDWGVALLIAAVFLTKSTAGLIILAIIVMYNYRVFIRLKYLVALIFFALFFLDDFLASIQWHIDYKLIGSAAYDNRYSRIDEIFSTWDFSDIIFGKGGYFYETAIAPYDLGAWDSFGQIVQHYGLFFFFIITYLIFSSSESKIYPVIILISLFSQSIWVTPLCTIFYFKYYGDK